MQTSPAELASMPKTTGLTQTVTVGPSENKELNFSFTAQQLTAESVEGGALKVLPAIEFPMLGMEMETGQQ
jgi:hypothetical protein